MKYLAVSDGRCRECIVKKQNDMFHLVRSVQPCHSNPVMNVFSLLEMHSVSSTIALLNRDFSTRQVHIAHIPWHDLGNVISRYSIKCVCVPHILCKQGAKI
jgi:hypothetical protein